MKELEKFFNKLKFFPKIFKYWRKIPQILSSKEKTLFLSFFLLFLISFSFLSINFYLKNTEVVPASGGKYIEGVIGQPRFINPILATNDIDRNLIELIFSGLMKYNEKGEVVLDLAEKYKVEEEGKVYKFYLKDALWQDGEKLTSEDIIFTIETIQNPEYKSPQRANWLGIKIEKAGENDIIFRLKNPYAGFLERLTLKIIPKHIWKDIPVENFPLTIYNLKPVGSGPYQFKDLKQNKSEEIVSLTLKRFSKYFNKSPYLSQISFKFLKEKDLLKSAQKGDIQGFSPPYFNFEVENLGFQKLSFSWPRYFALFFNPEKSKLLAEKEIRRALTYATNKTEIIEKVLSGEGKVVDSPVLPEIYGLLPPSKVYQFNEEIAESLLKEAGFKKEDGNWLKVVEKEFEEFKKDLRLKSRGEEVTRLQICLAKDPVVYPEGETTGYFGSLTEKAVIKFQEKYKEDILDPWGFKNGTGIVARSTRAKLNEVCREEPKTVPLKFTLTTAENPLLIETANVLKNQWESMGIGLEIESFAISELEKDFIKPRDYEILLFGEVLEGTLDPFPFWHSSQKKDPGLNLSLYENKKADRLLEQTRTSLDSELRAEKYQEFQDILIEEVPVIFLYSPDFLYFISPKIKGADLEIIIDPSKRFSNIGNWYVKTKRVWK